MKKHLTIVFLTTITSFFLSLNSCVEIVDIEDQYIEGISVNSLFSLDDTLYGRDTIKVFLTKTFGQFERYTFDSIPYYRDGYNIEENIFITNAEVYISKDSINFIKLSQKNRYYYYYQNNFIAENNNYYIKITKDSDILYAKSYIPIKTHILFPEITSNNYINEENNEYSEIKFTIEDIDNYNNYYRLKVYSLSPDSTKSNSSFYCFSPIISNFNSSQYSVNYVLFTDEQFKNQQINLSVYANSQAIGYIIELAGISKELYGYYSALYSYYSSTEAIFSLETGFSPPGNPITMYTNIINGYGLFAGSVICRDTIYATRDSINQ
ncbi:MAG: DUF4249 family protein [Bacteroidales bacterium]|nr:DUF4249 family protein [Bacteroidales bacterium]